jgi:Ca-activated chloride channel homolog
MFEFANDTIFWFLLLIPIILLLFIIHRRYRRKSLQVYAHDSKHSIILPHISSSKPWLQHIFQLLSILFLVVALAGPRIGSKLREVEKKGRELIIALDVSYSMLASDAKPNRLEMSKTAISRLFERLQDDKVGLIVFAGDAYTQIP